MKLNIKPISINEAYTSKRYKTPKYRGYVKHMMYLLPRKVEVWDKMELHIKVGFKSNASDIDNVVKPFTDILQKKFGFNDNQIWLLNVEKEITKEPYIEFKLKEYVLQN